METYDGIVIGAGHNGLICAGYLARAGLKVLIVERHLEMGGGLDAHEGKRAGFWHNAHSVNHRGVADLVWYRDLDLAEFGQEYIRLPISVALLTRDHRALLWYASEPEKTAASIHRFSPRDARTFLEVNQTYGSMARDILFREIYAPPVPWPIKKALFERSEAGRQYLQWQPQSILETVSRLFKHDAVRAMIAFLSVIRGYEADSKGLGMIVPAAIASGVNTQMAKGSSHKLAHTLHKMVVKAGVDVVESQAVARILMENGRAVGVRTADGRTFRASKFVISSVNPSQTFLQMMEPDQLPHGLAAKIEAFQYSKTTPVFTLHLALNHPIRWKAADYDADVDRSWIALAGVESLNDITEVYRDCRAGRLPRSLQLIGAQPGLHDTSQAPPGKCTAFFWQLAPGDLCREEGGRDHWDRIRDAFAGRMARHLDHYAKNLTSDNIVDQFGITPVDIERHLPNMVGGDMQCGELSESQIFDKRPIPECSQYRTPIPGLYMCGSSMHPGGNITGAPGYNAAGVVCRDLGIDPWWKPSNPVMHWEAMAVAKPRA